MACRRCYAELALLLVASLTLASYHAVARSSPQWAYALLGLWALAVGLHALRVVRAGHRLRVALAAPRRVHPG